MDKKPTEQELLARIMRGLPPLPTTKEKKDGHQAPDRRPVGR